MYAINKKRGSGTKYHSPQGLGSLPPPWTPALLRFRAPGIVPSTPATGQAPLPIADYVSQRSDSI